MSTFIFVTFEHFNSHDIPFYLLNVIFIQHNHGLLEIFICIHRLDVGLTVSGFEAVFVLMG